MHVSKKFFKRLGMLKTTPEYQEALTGDGSLLIRPHHKQLYRLFLDNTTGDVTSALRTALTARESFKVWLDPTVTVKVSHRTYVLNQ